jgi:guanosine-diphosphatase
MNGRARTRYARIIGAVAVFFVIFLFFLAPSDRVKEVEQYVSDHTTGQQSHLQPAEPISVDPATGKRKCTKSSDPSKPIIQYALMIDAGSTGSRIHVYRFNNCGETPELEDEVFAMTPKAAGGSGLSAYKDDAQAAAQSLDQLMAVAMKSVPDNYKSCTPIAVKATAGLRKLGTETSNKILEAVRFRLETEFPFPVIAKDQGGVEVMEGRDEGVYAWITTNYLLGKIGSKSKTPSAAVFDLGGSSTQIVFEPNFKSESGGMPQSLAPGDHKYDLKFGGREFSLYQHSHLGYGLMDARESIHKTVYESYVAQYGQDTTWQSQPVVHPCFIPGKTKEVTLKLDGDKSVTLNFTGPAEMSVAHCRAVAEKILQKEAACTLAPCSFHGVHQPSLAQTFATEDVYVFSYFYDRLKPLGMPDSFTLREMREITSQVCGGEANWGGFVHVKGAIEELRDRPEYCLDLNFMFALLHIGYEMPVDREVKIAKKIKDNEVGWCLGARYVQQDWPKIM